MVKNIQIGKTAEIKCGAGADKRKTGRCELLAPFAADLMRERAGIAADLEDAELQWLDAQEQLEKAEG